MAGDRAKKTAEGVEPLTISVTLGATLPTGDFGNVRPTVEIKNIRLDQPLEPQLERALDAAGKAWLAIDTEIEHRVMDMLSVDAGSTATPTLRDRVARLEAWQGTVRKNTKSIVDEVRRHKGILDRPKMPVNVIPPRVDAPPAKKTKRPEPLDDKVGWPYPESPGVGESGLEGPK
jgi:hypothetical protein